MFGGIVRMGIKAAACVVVLVVYVGMYAGAQAGPAELPGKGLAQHDFLYAGESHDRNIYVVRGGRIAWSYSDPAGKGEISDAVLLSSGDVLFTHQVGVTEISPE